MKILFPYMARWKAVNWTRYHSLFTCLASLGHQIYVLQPPPLESRETNFQEIDIALPENIHLVDVSVPSWLWGRSLPLEKILKKGVYSILSRRTAERLVKEHRIDVIFLYNIPQYRFLSIAGPRKCFDCADDYMAMLAHELGPLNNPAFMKIGAVVLERMIARSDAAFSVSNVLAEKYGRRLHVLPNGVDHAKADAALANPLHLDLPGPIVGFVGSFEYFIDFDLILGAAAALPDVTFLLVGGGRLWATVREQCARRGLRNVTLTGGVPHGEIFRHIGCMDVCLNIFKKIPISHGACPIKLFEYSSMRKPVVSTRLEELKHIDRGFLTFGDTVEEIVGSITRLLADDERRRRLADAGYRDTVERYSWPVIAATLERHLQAVVG